MQIGQTSFASFPLIISLIKYNLKLIENDWWNLYLEEERRSMDRSDNRGSRKPETRNSLPGIRLVTDHLGNESADLFLYGR